MFQFYQKKITFIVIVASFAFSSSAGGDFQRVGSSDGCISPGGGRGICRNLNKCEPLLGLLIKAKSRPRPWVIDFLKRSHCGFEGKDPIVCCPLQGKPKPSHGIINLTVKSPLLEKFSNRSCGSIHTLDKIIGGNVASPHEFPWMVLIGYKTRAGVQYRCGGSLISPRYVLTAAHCVTTLKDLFPTSVRLGEHVVKSGEDCDGWEDCDTPGRDIPIEEVTPHPDYYKPELRNDIALIRLAKSVKFKESIQPICLPLNEDFRERSLPDDKAVVVGWGAAESGTSSQVLRKVTLPIVPREECSKVYKKRVPITESHICAGGEAGKDSCRGDSGGPLSMIGVNPLGEPAYVQHGIVSFGPRHCGTKGMPGVYTKVSYYVDWIAKNVKE